MINITDREISCLRNAFIYIQPKDTPRCIPISEDATRDLQRRWDLKKIPEVVSLPREKKK